MGIDTQLEFVAGWNAAQRAAYETAKEKGFHDVGTSSAERIALAHSELSEALEAMRNGNPASEKLPSFSSVAEELADCVIRIMDLAECHGYGNIALAVIAKMEYNAQRTIRHGKAF